MKIAQPLHLPPRPDGRLFRAFIYDITQNIIFKRIVAISVIISSSLLFVTVRNSNILSIFCISNSCVGWFFQWNEDKRPTDILVIISSALNCVFVSEVVMKLIAFTPRGYWQSRRNRYDLMVTTLGVVWVILNFTVQVTPMR